MKYLLFLLFIIVSGYIEANTNIVSDTTIVTDTILHKDSYLVKDTLIHKGTFSFEGKGTSSSPDKMPWIVALLIGLSSVVVNIIVAIMQKKANKNNINRQLDNASDAMNRQISNAKEIAILEFNRTVKSRNRQDWINTVRDTCSELIANFESFNIEYINSKLTGKSAEFKMQQKYSKEISLLATKLELLLNPKEEKTKKALEHLGKLSAEIINDSPVNINYDRNGYKQYEVEFLNTIKEILKEEWERVKSGA